MGLRWSEHRKPCPECRYDHVVADMGAGQISIEWKGWKDYDSHVVYLPDCMGGGVYNHRSGTLDGIKAEVDALVLAWAKELLCVYRKRYGGALLTVFNEVAGRDSAGITSSLG